MDKLTWFRMSMPAEHAVVSKRQSLYIENSKVRQDCQNRATKNGTLTLYLFIFILFVYLLNDAILSSLFLHVLFR